MLGIKLKEGEIQTSVVLDTSSVTDSLLAYYRYICGTHRAVGTRDPSEIPFRVIQRYW